MKSLAILGASGHGKVVADCAEACGWQSVTFYDDARPSSLAEARWPVDGNMASLLNALHHYDGVIVAIGDCAARLKKVVMLRQAGARLVTLIHPAAAVSRYVSIGDASVIFAGAVINVDTFIGDAVIINTSASVDHDCKISDGVHISPGAHLAGAVSVGERTWIGIGASVKQGIALGADVVVGAGAAVTRNVVAGDTVVGVRALKK